MLSRYLKTVGLKGLGAATCLSPALVPAMEYIYPCFIPNVTVQLLSLILFIPEVSYWNLGPETGYPDCGFCTF
jgi:hypothetical protein